MKKCPKCGGFYSDTAEKCSNCNCDLKKMTYAQNSSNNYNDNKSKGKGQTLLIVIAIFVALGIIGSLFGGESQYEKDFKSMQNKSIDEMSDGEREAFDDYLEWELENND